MAKKHYDTKQLLIGIVIMLAVWALGVLSAGRIPYFFDYVYLPTESGDTFKLLYPFLFLAYSVIFAVVCKRKSKDVMFFGSYLLLIIPAVAFLFLWINQYLGPELADLVLLLLLIPSMPLWTVFDAFFSSFYGDIRPAGFSEAHIIFGVVLILACALPPIVYRLVKPKEAKAQ